MKYVYSPGVTHRLLVIESEIKSRVAFLKNKFGKSFNEGHLSDDKALFEIIKCKQETVEGWSLVEA